MKRSADFLLREVADTQVLVPLGDAMINFPGMVTLNSTGVYIWGLLEQEQSVESLTAAMMEQYAVDRETALRDVVAFIGKLIPIGAILDN